MNGQPIVYETLARLEIQYEEVTHPPMFTIEDMAKLTFPPDVTIAKNLFLRDHKGRRHFLVMVHPDKNADLQRLGSALNTRLSFASDARLEQYLGLKKGSVSPFGVLNDAASEVEVFIDAALESCPRVGVHPNQNTASLLLPPADVIRVVRDHGNSVEFIDA